MTHSFILTMENKFFQYKWLTQFHRAHIALYIRNWSVFKVVIMFKFPSSKFSILYNEPWPIFWTYPSWWCQPEWWRWFPNDNSDQPEADNVFTNDDNEGDEIDTELDPTPSQSQQKEKLMAADGIEWTMATTHAEYENPPPLSVIVPQWKSQQAVVASSPVEFLDLYLTSYMSDCFTYMLDWFSGYKCVYLVPQAQWVSAQQTNSGQCNIHARSYLKTCRWVHLPFCRYAYEETPQFREAAELTQPTGHFLLRGVAYNFPEFLSRWFLISSIDTMKFL